MSRVLVLCTMRMLVDQWAERLRADEGLRVTVLDSARASLELLDGEDTGVGVLVATYARVHQGLGGRALAGLDGLILTSRSYRSRTKSHGWLRGRGRGSRWSTAVRQDRRRSAGRPCGMRNPGGRTFPRTGSSRCRSPRARPSRSAHYATTLLLSFGKTRRAAANGSSCQRQPAVAARQAPGTCFRLARAR